MTASARRYGFHAMFKAPFHLAEGRTPEELDAALARFAARRAGVAVPRLSLARLDGFFALVPGAEAAELHALADEVVTLTDRIPDGQQSSVRRTPIGWFAASLGATVPVDALALFTEAEPGAPFTLHAVHPLRPVP
jgi:hypothetical protein